MADNRELIEEARADYERFPGHPLAVRGKAIADALEEATGWRPESECRDGSEYLAKWEGIFVLATWDETRWVDPEWDTLLPAPAWCYRFPPAPADGGA